MTARGSASVACTVAGAVLLTLALLVGYGQRALFDSEQFANRATAALEADDVRTLVAREVTDRIVLANARDLVAARPLIESAASGVIGDTAFRNVFRAAVLDAHRTVFSQKENTVTLAVADAGTVVAEGLQAVRPSLARRVGATGRLPLLRRDLDERTAGLVRAAERIELLAAGLLVAGLAFALAGLALARDRRRAVARLGVGVALGGIAVAVAYAVARGVVLERVGERAAAGEVWDAFLGDLRTAAWIMAGSGAVLAAAAASLIRPVAIEPTLVRLAREPAHGGARVARGLALVAAGALVVVRPNEAVTVVATLAGVYLVYKGVEAILRAVSRPQPDVRIRIGRRAAAVAIAAALITGASAAFLATGGATEAAPRITACNGKRELCSRPLDQVVLPATHNSMSAPGPGWYSSEQDRPIAGQLADGIRGLLIDTHYGDRLPNGRVRTELDAASQKLTGDQVGLEAMAAALRTRERLGFRGRGERGVYLCHSFCELGATPLADALATIRQFLVTHPGEVLVVINEDYVEPRDIVAAVRRAGLERMVWRPTGDGASPTLGEMARANRRLVLLAEHRGGGAPWYQAAYDRVLEETPYAFKRPEQLTAPSSCLPNRGPEHAPLFLLNHWITTDPAPLPSNAAKVNTRSVLLGRARECARTRGHVPNLLAVNFYRQGDLFAVVDELNAAG